MQFTNQRTKNVFLSLLKTALCALLMLITQSFATIILCARSIWPDFEYDQIIANATPTDIDTDIFTFSPEIKYYILGSLILYLILISILRMF